MSDKIGFIGMGIMGAGMTANLLKAGHAVTIWNRTSPKMEPLLALGATAADSPEAVARKSDIIFLCLGGTNDVREVMLGENSVIQGAKPGSLVVDHSTISPQGTKDMGAVLKEAGINLVDAPISGGSEGAKNGTLSIMIGGESADIDRARPYMEVMGKTLTHVGELGAGQMVKAVNQILVVNAMQGVAEAMLFAQAGGLDLEKTIAAVSGGAAASWALTNRAPQMAARDWRPGFTIDWQTKDIDLVMEAANEMGIPLPATALIFQLYRSLQTSGHGQEGNHALVKAIEKLSGIEVGSEA